MIVHKRNILLYTLITCAFMLICAGCDRDAQRTGDEKEFAVDKPYERGPLSVHVRLDRDEINIAETVLLELVATIETGYKVRMPQVDQVYESFGIVDWDNLGDRLDENNNVVMSYQYRLEPFLSGSFSIPAFTFEFYDVNSVEEKKYELVTEPIDIEVSSLLGEQRAELVIADIEDVVEMPEKASYWWALAIAVVVIIGAAIWLLLRRKSYIELVRIFKPAHEIAYERLRVLVKDDLVNAGRIKEFYERISDILRHYIEHRFDLRAPERTTEEFLAELAVTDVLAESDKQGIGDFLLHCDLVKFAMHSPSAEQIQKTFDLVKDFIEKTKSEEQKVDVTETEKTEQVVEVGSL